MKGKRREREVSVKKEDQILLKLDTIDNNKRRGRGIRNKIENNV